MPYNVWYVKRGFQSTSPVRGTTKVRVLHLLVQVISIHVPREGDDESNAPVLLTYDLFQSTSPVRGTTPAVSMPLL